MKDIAHTLYFVFQIVANMLLICFFMLLGGFSDGVSFENAPKTTWVIIACCLVSMVFSMAEAMRLCAKHGATEGV